MPLLSTKAGFLRIAPILMTSDPDEWEKKNVLNPFTELTPLEPCDGLKVAVLAIHAFWSSYDANPSPSERRIRQGEMTRVPAAAARIRARMLHLRAVGFLVGGLGNCFIELEGTHCRRVERR
jgi:hypothetical protein